MGYVIFKVSRPKFLRERCVLRFFLSRDWAAQTARHVNEHLSYYSTRDCLQAAWLRNSLRIHLCALRPACRGWWRGDAGSLQCLRNRPFVLKVVRLNMPLTGLTDMNCFPFSYWWEWQLQRQAV